MPNFKSKFSMAPGLQKPPAVCHAPPPPPPPPTGTCPLDLGDRTVWFFDIKMSVSDWTDEGKIRLNAMQILNGKYGGLKQFTPTTPGPPRHCTVAMNWTYDPALCTWKLAWAINDSAFANSADFDLELPLLDTLPEIVAFQSPIVGDYSGFCRYVGFVWPTTLGG